MLMRKEELNEATVVVVEFEPGSPSQSLNFRRRRILPALLVKLEMEGPNVSGVNWSALLLIVADGMTVKCLEMELLNCGY